MYQRRKGVLSVTVILICIAFSGCHRLGPYRTKGVEIKSQQRILEVINKARRPEEIARATGLDKETARRIIELRHRHGPFGFRRLDEILPFWKLRADIRDRILALFGSAFYGQWVTLPYDMQKPGGGSVSPAHSAMLHTGRVLLIPEADTTETVLWDPTDEVIPQFTFPDNQPTDFLFCSGHSFLSDGRLLAVGGGGNYVSNAINTAWKFDPDAGTNGEWNKTSGSMSFSRWYPTAVTLGYPYVLVAGGVFGSPVQQVNKLEVYNENTDQFMVVSGPVGNTAAADREFPETYPGLHLLPTGKILYTHTGFGHGFLSSESATTASYLELAGPTTGTWTDMTNNMNFPDRTEGMSIQIFTPTTDAFEQAARVIVFGGGQPDTGGRPRAESIDTPSLSASTPWQLIPDYMDVPRFHATAVLLPDGKALVFGGAEHGDDGTGGHTEVEIFDPATNTFSPVDSLQYARGYHTVTVLLPSGKIMVSGGISGSNETKIEIYSPPYLFKGARPTITSVPAQVHHGASFQVQTPDAASVDKVVFVRPMAFTHHTDTEQRVIELKFTKGAGVLTATTPSGIHSMGDAHPLAPRGYYMLFVLNGSGVPSVARFVHLH